MGAFVEKRLRSTIFRAAKIADPFLFPGCRENPEQERHARFIVWFGILGAVFEFLYAAFYAAIGHEWGMAIVGGAGAWLWPVPSS